uniref:Uncharacterized protein n=1 Tax=Arundo donax TaxID=35708 RepID=A0A0A9E0A4_ARUDO
MVYFRILEVHAHDPWIRPQNEDKRIISMVVLMIITRWGERQRGRVLEPPSLSTRTNCDCCRPAAKHGAPRRPRYRRQLNRGRLSDGWGEVELVAGGEGPGAGRRHAGRVRAAGGSRES